MTKKYSDIEIDIEVDENILQSPKDGLIKITNTHLHIKFLASYYLRFPKTKISEFINSNSLNSIVHIHMRIYKYQDDHSSVHIEDFKNHLLTEKYDSLENGEWEGRVSEIAYFKGLPYASLCLLVKFFLEENEITMRDEVILHAKGTTILSQTKDIQKLVNFYKNVGLKIKNPKNLTKDLRREQGVDMVGDVEEIFNKCSNSDIFKYLDENNVKINFQERSQFVQNSCTIL